jgi:bifunctional DNA-binding transcriptional regulator/antitoxin component of YhaV-PrlF toxin-antitoxin module
MVQAMSKARYFASPRVYAISKVFQHGKTQVPKEVRQALRLSDGDRILWYSEDGIIFVKRLE